MWKLMIGFSENYLTFSLKREDLSSFIEQGENLSKVFTLRLLSLLDIM